MKQELIWSDSRYNTLMACARKYFYHYYLSWGGWFKNASEDKKKAYVLKNMTNMYMLVGNIVHNTIENILISIRDNKDIPSLGDLKINIINKLNNAWMESKSGEWKKSPKKYINLFEHYYEIDLDKDKIEFYKNRTINCIENFYNSNFLKLIKSLKKEDFVTVEDLAKFKMQSGVEGFIKIDFGFRYNNKLYLVDWKTGKQNDNVINQLASYAIYAINNGLAKSPEDIIIIPAFLLHIDSDILVKDLCLNVSMDQLSMTANRINDEYKTLKLFHEKKDDVKYFPITDNLRECSQCNYREICEGGKRVK